MREIFPDQKKIKKSSALVEKATAPFEKAAVFLFFPLVYSCFRRSHVGLFGRFSGR